MGRDASASKPSIPTGRITKIRWRVVECKGRWKPGAARGFIGKDCAAARLSATNGAGTDSGTKFIEVESEMVGGYCNVRGWWWSTQVGGASRQ